MSTSNPPLAEIAYEHLRTKLDEGLVRAGSRLDYAQISRDIGVSTTPVREAMNKLASEGYVDLVPRRGAIVRMPTRDELVDLYLIREALEPFATEKATQKITPAQLRVAHDHVHAMKSLWEGVPTDGSVGLDEETLRKHIRHDRAFHQIIIEAAGSPLLKQLVGRSHAISQVFILFEQVSSRIEHDNQAMLGRVEVLTAIRIKCHIEAWEAHAEILKAIEELDAGAARSLMAAHIRKSRNHLLDAYDVAAEKGLISLAK